MQYPYVCDECDTNTLVTKSMRNASDEERCEFCDTVLTRIFLPVRINGAKVEDSYYSHALGKVVSSSQRERVEANAQGLIEVGNENVSKHTKAPEIKYPTVDELYKAGAFE